MKIKTVISNTISRYLTVSAILLATCLPFSTFAADKCSKAFSKEELAGALFLHRANPGLASSPLVTSAANVRYTAKVSQPAEKIAAWIRYINDTHFSADKKKSLEQIKEYYFRKYVIKFSEIPQSYYDLQVRILREQGHGNVQLTDAQKRQMTETLTREQRQSLEAWLDYFFSADTFMYPMWLKFWAFDGMLKLGKIDFEKGDYAKRGRTTVAPFADLNREALALVMDSVLKFVNKKSLSEINDEVFMSHLKNASFAKLYVRALTTSSSKKFDLKVTEGKWVKYNQGTPGKVLSDTLYGWETGWCTAGESTAQQQLARGDFYVYYSNDQMGQAKVPRIAIRMQGRNIAEVRGRASNQHLDNQIAGTSVLSNKLKEFGNEGKAYEQKVSHMQLLTAIELKHNAGVSLSKTELRFLYELDEKIVGFGYENDPRIKDIISTRNKRRDFGEIFGYHESQVSLTTEEALSGGISFHYGDLDLGDIRALEGLKLPQTVGGNLNLKSLTSAVGLTLPQTVEGMLDLRSLTLADGLKLPETVRGGLIMYGLTSIEGLTLPNTIGGSLHLSGLLSADGLTLPHTIGGGLYLSGLLSADGLTLPHTVRGGLSLNGLRSAKGLKLPQTVDGDLNLRSLPSAEGLMLPQTVGSDLDLSSLTSASGLILPQTVGGCLVLSSLTSAKGLKLPQTVHGYLDLSSLTSAKGLILPQAVRDSIFLSSLTSAEGLTFPQSVGGDLRLPKLKSVQGITLPRVSGNIVLAK